MPYCRRLLWDLQEKLATGFYDDLRPLTQAQHRVQVSNQLQQCQQTLDALVQRLGSVPALEADAQALQQGRADLALMQRTVQQAGMTRLCTTHVAVSDAWQDMPGCSICLACIVNTCPKHDYHTER